MAWNGIVGQALAVGVLQQHLGRGRTAAGYLFVGPAGVGKRRVAVELAKAINCAAAPHGPCDACDSCGRILRGVYPDLHQLSPVGSSATIRIEDIRHVLERVSLRPFMARRQVVILDGADRLTDEAANALLKMLEEPPSQSMFVLLAQQPSGCLPTIVSRCQVIRFERLGEDVVRQLLAAQELKGLSEAQIEQIAHLARGSMERAEALAKDWKAYQRIVEHVTAADASRWLTWSAPTEREEMLRWLDCSIMQLRDTALEGANAAAADAALECIELAESLDQSANTRLVGIMLRERWIELLK